MIIYDMFGKLSGLHFDSLTLFVLTFAHFSYLLVLGSVFTQIFPLVRPGAYKVWQCAAGRALFEYV